MRHVALLITFISIAASASVSAEELSYDREFKQLKDQRDKALASSAEPINRRYKESLDQLLRRATQGNDLTTAVTIKRELDVLVASQTSPTKISPPGSERPARTTPANKLSVAGSTWQWYPGETLAFYPDGKAVLTKGSGESTWAWQLEGDGTITLDKGRFTLTLDKHGKTAVVNQSSGKKWTITRKNG